MRMNPMKETTQPRDPLERLLRAAVRRTGDQLVKRWLLGLCRGEQAQGSNRKRG